MFSENGLYRGVVFQEGEVVVKGDGARKMGWFLKRGVFTEGDHCIHDLFEDFAIFLLSCNIHTGNDFQVLTFTSGAYFVSLDDAINTSESGGLVRQIKTENIKTDETIFNF